VKFDLLIKKIHTYVGLQSTVALLVCSIAILMLPFDTKNETEVIHTKYDGDLNVANLDLAIALHKKVGVKYEKVPQGWMLSEKGDDLTVNSDSLNYSRKIIISKLTGDVVIESRRLSMSEFINRMHQESFGRRVPSDSLWVWAWAFYIEISIIALLLLPVTGLYIWLAARPGKQVWATVSMAISASLMAVVWVGLR
jgi:hypothetical protein